MTLIQDEIDNWKKEVVVNHCLNCKGITESPFCSVRCKYEWMQVHPDLKIDFNAANNILKNNRSLVSIMAQQKEKLLEIQDLSTFGTNQLLNKRNQ